MPRKLISFLGYNRDKKYPSTTYNYQDDTYLTSFATLAMTKFFKPEQVIVLVTQEARDENFDDLCNAVQIYNRDHEEQLPLPEGCLIPSGKVEHEMWEIFSIIADQLQKGDQIIFDISNGFRSLPVLSFLAAVYIKTIRAVTIERLVYGAFDAGEKVYEGKLLISSTAPVFDLSPFLSLLDWTTAVNTFQQTGRVENLAALTTDLGGKPAEKFAKQLEAFSQELLAARPVGTAWAASKLPELLAAVKNDSRPESKPLGLLLDSIESTFSLFQLKSVKFDKFDTAYNRIQSQSMERDLLRMQLKMIDWYINKNLPIQAITLTREWLITLVAYIKKLDIFDRKQRDEARDFIFESDYEVIDIVNIWKQVGNIEPNKRLTGDIRNDIAHCGMDKNNNRTIQKIIREIKDIYLKLYKLLPNQP